MTKMYEHGAEQFRLERSPIPVYEYDEATDGRLTAYIALPIHTTTLEEESDILWWSKVHSEPEWWTDGDEHYKVYQVYVKERYLHHVTEELQQINGFYLRRKLIHVPHMEDE